MKSRQNPEAMDMAARPEPDAADCPSWWKRILQRDPVMLRWGVIASCAVVWGGIAYALVF